MTAPQTHYEVLSVARDATAAQLRLAYRRAAQKHHPDRVGTQGSDMMALVNEAYAVLSHPQRRASYDRWMDARDARRRADAAVAAARPSRAETRKAWGLVAATATVALLAVGTVLLMTGAPVHTGGTRSGFSAGR